MDIPATLENTVVGKVSTRCLKFFQRESSRERPKKASQWDG